MQGIKHKNLLIVVIVGLSVAFVLIGYSYIRENKKPLNNLNGETKISNLDSTDIKKITEDVKQHDNRINNPDVTYQLEISQEKLTKGPSTITLKQGQSARIDIRGIDEEVRVKLEGYDIITENHPSDNVPGGFAFVAEKKGNFNYYLLPEEEENDNGQPILLGTIIVE